MTRSLRDIIDSYNPDSPLEQASTIPAPWYTDQNLYDLELQTVFANSWQLAGRVDQLRQPGQYVTSDIAGEPVVVVRGTDGVLRGFFNVCRHHAAAVMTEPEGKAAHLRCPYHGWTYSLAGELKGTPDFSGVCNFDRAANGLLPVQTSVWENWVFVRVEGIDTTGRSATNEQSALESFLGADLINQIRPLGIEKLHWMERRHYEFRLQLEGLRRQLSRRWLSRALPAQRSRQRARLQQLHDRERPTILFAVESDRQRRR